MMAIEISPMRIRLPMRFLLLMLAVGPGFATAASASASDYATAISAYRHAHGLPRVQLDGRLGAVALRQARASRLRVP